MTPFFLSDMDRLSLLMDYAGRTAGRLRNEQRRSSDRKAQNSDLRSDALDQQQGPQSNMSEL